MRAAAWCWCSALNRMLGCDVGIICEYEETDFSIVDGWVRADGIDLCGCAGWGRMAFCKFNGQGHHRRRGHLERKDIDQLHPLSDCRDTCPEARGSKCRLRFRQRCQRQRKPVSIERPGGNEVSAQEHTLRLGQHAV